MSKQILAIAAIILVIFSSCEEDINNSYELSDATKSYLNYDVGTSWSYDVSVNKNIYLKTNHLIVDTIIYNRQTKTYSGQKFDFARYTISSIPHNVLRFDTILNLKDSIYLFGEYRVFDQDMDIKDSLDLPRLRRYGVFPYDTSIFRSNYVVYDTIYEGDLNYEDVLSVLEVKKESFTNEMRNIATSEEYWRAKIGSTLNKNETYYDLLLANSSGFEYFKHQVERRQEFFTAFEMGYEEGNLDTTRFDNGIGIYSLEKLTSPVTVNGKSYNDVTVVKTKYNAQTVSGTEELNDVEFWIAPGGGYLKIVNSTNKTAWSLK